ncbi:hypothetical protein OJAV_G00235650 [Oryzias javanicus]|uniref:Uncharacterized protein n=1 Tax=Oryzias javanicus TaxID=123683 RepID=A0A437BYF3_ORYJA|nr:hypothetical protein OJAV_G00235650 [Oryzias javanicus]
MLLEMYLFFFLLSKMSSFAQGWDSFLSVSFLPRFSLRFLFSVSPPSSWQIFAVLAVGSGSGCFKQVLALTSSQLFNSIIQHQFVAYLGITYRGRQQSTISRLPASSLRSLVLVSPPTHSAHRLPFQFSPVNCSTSNKQSYH